MTKAERKAKLLAAQYASMRGDHATARELFASLGIGYVPAYMLSN